MRRPAVGRANVRLWIWPLLSSAACPGDAPVVEIAFVAGLLLSATAFPRTAPSAATTTSSELPPSTSPVSLHPSNASWGCPPTAASPVATSSSPSGLSGKLRTTNSASPAKSRIPRKPATNPPLPRYNEFCASSAVSGRLRHSIQSLRRYRLRVRTLPSQGKNPGSNPGIAANSFS